MRPFNLEEAKAGKPVCTREGKPAHILKFDARGSYPIIGYYESKDAYDGDVDIVCFWCSDGRMEIGHKHETDLMMADEPAIVKYYNIYYDPTGKVLPTLGAGFYDTEEEARRRLVKAQGLIGKTQKIEL